MEINISVSGKITTDGIPLKSIKNTVGFFDAVTFSCKPKFVVKAEGELSLKGNLKATVGFRVSTKTGITSLNTTPKMSLKSELEVTIFVGLVLGPEVKVKNGDIAEGKIKGEIGVEINANHTKLEVDEEYGEKKHPCKFCVDGDLIYKRSIVITTKVGDIEELEYNKEYKREFKFADWYYSIDKGKFGLGECPYITYRIIVQAIDEKEKGLPGVTVFEDYVTGEDGRAIFYLPNGYYDANPTKDGYIYIPTTFLGKTKVNSKAKNLTFLMVPENGGSGGENPDSGNTGEDDDNPDTGESIPTDSVVINEITFSDANFRQYVLSCDEDVEVIGYDVEIETYPLNNTETSLQGSSQECGNSDMGGIDALQNNKTPFLTYQSTATPFVKTIHQVTLADDNHIDYTDLYPNEIYNFYVVKESADDIPFGDVLTSDNLLYIKQYTTDENGNLSIDYIPSLEYENATEILVCYKRIDISEGYEVSISDLPYTGNEQAPNIELKVGGVSLTEGQDYELEGDYYVTDIGEYIVIISGIGKYEGSIDVPFKVKGT